MSRVAEVRTGFRVRVTRSRWNLCSCSKAHGAFLLLLLGLLSLLTPRAMVWVWEQWRAHTCLRVPPSVRNWKANSTLAPPAGYNEAPFLLLWSTNASSFTLRSRRCLESIFYHHPRATALVYSNQLPMDFFAEFQRRHYNVLVRRYDIAQLLANTPAEPWLSRLAEWESGPYFYSHVTDAVRLALLFHVGGVYVDFDVIVCKPIPVASAGVSSALRVRGSRPLRNTLGIESYEGLGGLTGPTVNGAVMAFDRGSRFLWNCLDNFAAQYMPDRWSWNGPELLTRVRLRCQGVDEADVRVEPRESFYPIYWKGLATYANALDSDLERELWSTIVTCSYVVHVWNRKSAELTFANGSILHRLHNRWMVLPSQEDCT